MDHREIGPEQLVTDNGRAGHAARAGEIADKRVKRIRPKIVGRGIDQIARQHRRLDQPVDLGRVSTLGRHQPWRRLGLAIAIEPISAKPEADGGQDRIAIVTGQVIAAFRQGGASQAKHQSRASRLGTCAKQIACHTAILSWQRQRPAALAAKAIGLGPGRMRGGKPRLGKLAVGDGNDGQRLKVGHEELQRVGAKARLRNSRPQREKNSSFPTVQVANR